MNLKFLTLVLLGLVFPMAQAATATDSLVVYSARNEQLIKPMFDAYQKETGVSIKYVTDKAAPLMVRLKAEASATPADVLITVDAGNLWQAAKQGLLARVHSKVLEKNIPAHLRDPQGRWFGLSVRARTLVYNNKRIKPAQLSSYEQLADPKWKGRLCLRTSKKVYNQSLVATLIARVGEAKAEKIVRGWVANLATSVFSNDTKVMQAIAAGQCDVGIVNTYYYGRLLKKSPDLPLSLYWPNQTTSGVHVNVSGAGVVAASKHKKAAQAFLEWMSGATAQRLLADGNMEYPANPAIKPHAIVSAWGEFKQDTINLSSAGRLQVKAIKLMDRAGYK
ncbi:MAG TPA: extracellular solute-binding protein [Acidiferrobacteraceae bacterium]|nr:extracellular solute-binding protein [Acidiferrobacteraceae bacterium]